ncbi:MAG: hypothetical protein A2136_10915 [Chloroflexi bacterium RBG_16_54_11]|nr:MAG: hypothetical protein A2136_10915 [Chloroflexi bacterium RBG_16_54_11]
MDSNSHIQMNRYLIETPHTAQDCQQIIDLVYAMGYLSHFEWGCLSGDHTGWAIIEAENEAQARLAVPSLIRRKARVVKLTKFDGKDVTNQKTHSMNVIEKSG